MNAYSRPYAVPMPDLPADGVRLWAEKSQDLVFMLDMQDRILSVLHSELFDAQDAHHWLGLNLQAVFSPDTQAKVALLLANDAARPGCDARWRHLNLQAADGRSLPVLARYLSLPPAHGMPTRTVLFRDLRPMEAMTQRYINAHQDLERSYLELRSHLAALPAPWPVAPVPDLVARIKQTGYVQVMDEVVQSLERQCLQALLHEAGGDAQRAADMAGCSLEDWQRRLAALGQDPSGA